jgi:hypothetical protein
MEPTKSSSGLMRTIGHSTSGAANPFDKGCLPDARRWMIAKMWTLAGLREIRLVHAFLASYRVWLMLMSFAGGQNFLNRARFVERHHVDSADTSKIRAPVLTTSRRSRPRFHGDRWASIHQNCKGHDLPQFNVLQETSLLLLVIRWDRRFFTK